MEGIKKTNRSMTLGLDLGVASIGWCLYENKKTPVSDAQGEVSFDDNKNIKYIYSPQHIIDMGVFVFNQLEKGKSGKLENVQRRQKRSIRRQRRRKVRRLYSLRHLFYEQFHVDFLNDVISPRHCKLTPFEIKIKGINNKLSEEELMIALYHYMKYRGFQSNRKAKDDNSKDNEKMLGGIKNVKKQLEEKNLYISQYLVNEQNRRIKEDPSNNKIHNSDKNYIFTVSRDIYEKEIIRLLDTQIMYDVIDENFKNKYLDIYRKRRSYTDGPNKPSPFEVNFEKKVGNCFVYKDEKRAPKDSLSAQRFILLSKLVNFRYRYLNVDKKDSKLEQKLTPEQIKTIEDEFIFAEKITYSKLLKRLKIETDNIVIKDLRLTKKEYETVRKNFVKENNLESDLKIEDNDDLREKFQKELDKKYLDKVFFKGSSLIHSIHSEEKLANDLKNDEFFDNVAKTLLIKKDDDSISKMLMEYSIDKDTINCLLEMDIDATKTINLSIKLCKELLPHLRNGLNYAEAMDKCGHNHSEKKLDENDGDGIIPPIDEALKEINITLANPVVKNTLVQLRKILNSITKKYGQIDDCVIEFARELKLSFKDRNKIYEEQLENQSKNNYLRNEMIGKYPNKFKSYNDISKDDLIKYKLFKEQNGICVYTNENIIENYLFDDDLYQVDHIIPYNLSFDDSYSNKVLVKASANQEKKMEIPMNCPNIAKNVKIFLKSHSYISKQKKEKLLATEIDENFKNRDLNDTSYLSKIARDFITYFVLKKGCECRTNKGQITDFLRKHWGLSGKIHTYYPMNDGTYASYENKMYQSKFYDDFKLDFIETVSKEEITKLVFTFKNGENKNNIELTIKEEKINKNGESTTSLEDKTLNSAIMDFAENYLSVFKVFQNNNYKNKSIEDIQKAISGERESYDNNYSATYSAHLENAMLVLGKVREIIQKIIDEKNRDNHLHHALDAAIIGVCTPRMVHKISSANANNNTDKIICPQPYEDFDKEVLIRVYEHDKDKILSLLNKNVKYYKNNPLTKYDVHTLLPVRQPDHDIKGALTKETIFGAKEINGKLFATKRIKINKEIKKEDVNKIIEKIVDKESGNKAVYESIKEWLNNKKPTPFPILKSKGTYIKSIEIENGSAENKVPLSSNNNRFADNDKVVRVEIYKKKNSNSDKLYFVPIYYYQILQRKKTVNDKIKYALMHNQNKVIQLSGIQLLEEYEKIAVLPRYSLIELTFTNGNNGFAYSGGVTKGTFEIYSPVGDFYDIKKEFQRYPTNDQLQITCSSIKSIKVRSISVLGKIS